MLTPQVPGGFGLGTMVNADRRRFGHDGGNVGYGCISYAWPHAGVAVAVMANSDDAREVLGGILAAAERRYGSTPQATTAGAVTGRYLLRDDYPIDIGTADGRLTLTAPGQPAAVLLPLPDGRYRHPGLDLEIRFHRVGDEPSTMELRQENVTQTATCAP